MTKQALAFAIILLHTLSAHYSLAMETKNQNPDVTVINKGLLTEITAQIAVTRSQGIRHPQFINEINTKKDTLIKLIHYNSTLRTGETEIFCPILLKQSDKGLESLGQFKRDQHQEAIEAFRRKQAIYCHYGQGVLIYNLDQQPDPGLCTTKKSLLEDLQKNHSNWVFTHDKQSRY